MIDLSEHDKRVLSTIGHNAYGKELAAILEKCKRQLCSIDSVDKTKDYAPQVEGRLLFSDFADEIMRHLTFQKKMSQEPRKPFEVSGYE